MQRDIQCGVTGGLQGHVIGLRICRPQAPGAGSGKEAEQ